MAAVSAQITVGARLFALRFTNLRNADGALHTFTDPEVRMVLVADGSVKIDWVNGASSTPGTVTYALQAADVDTPGIYALQVRDTAGGLMWFWPAARDWLLEICPLV